MSGARAIRIAICGTGSFGTTRAKALDGIEGAKVVLGWSRSEASRARFTRETGAPTVKGWEDLCASDQADAVFVCTPNAEHFCHALAALEAGKHVLVETPLSLSYADARQLADRAERSRLVLHHGAKWRHHPDHSRYITQFRRIGSLLFAIDHAAFDFGPERGWYRDRKLTGGARAFLPYVMVQWLEAFGDVTAAVGAESTADEWDAASLTLSFAAGGHATISYALGLGIPERPVREVCGTEGIIITCPDGKTVFVRGEEQSVIERRPVDIVACECRAFLDEVRGVRDHRPDLSLDLRALELVDQAFRR
jgi:predicted dehydrogenase